MYKLFFAALLVVAAPSFALAGGGGGSSKSTGSVRFENEDPFLTVGVAVNPSRALLNSQSPDEFLRRGGRFVDPNSNVTIGNVRTGNVRVVFSYEDSAGQFVSRTVNVLRGDTTVVEIPQVSAVFND